MEFLKSFITSNSNKLHDTSYALLALDEIYTAHLTLDSNLINAIIS